ncbi:MAG: hypothetical protein JXB24_03360 [Bacteroidales bacterium]|nr:hypothetical protein [Bacteroidales bacterium]
MKQFFSILITILYLLLSTGLKVTAHYCQGRLESVRLLAEADPCSCETLDLRNTCCSNEEISFQAEFDIHTTSNSRIDIPRNKPAFFITERYTTFTIESEKDYSEKVNVKICLPDKPLLWLLYCSLTYYG